MSRYSIMKAELLKKSLIAKPNIVEFVNCEVNKTYQKSVSLRNIDTQPTRFEISARPACSAFTVFVESATAGDLAPGMRAKLIIRYRSIERGAEPEETLVLRVRDARSLALRIRVRRDPPRLRALNQVFSSLFPNKKISDSTMSSIDMCFTSTTSSDRSATDNKSFSSDYTESSDNSLLPNATLSTFDCKKCFVGEFVYLTTTLKNVGGKGRFFIMSETDWCSFKLEDVTFKNALSIPPFAISPAYFSLKPNEQLTLNTYFFPDSGGLQVDELYFISDNCGVKTFEIIGDGIVFEAQSLQFDNKIKYQWFHTEDKEICTVRYIDLGTGNLKESLACSFTITSKCELDVSYHWKITDLILYPDSYKNTVSRKAIDPDRVWIDPSSGIFEANSSTKFTVIVEFAEDLIPDRYRATLRLIIEDLPFAAISNKCNFSYENSQLNTRLCDNPVDIYFENIEIRATCKNPITKNDENLTCSDINCQLDNVVSMLFTDETLLDSEKSEFFVVESSSSSSSNDVCRFIKGYGTCDCCRSELISTGVLRPSEPLYVGVEHTFVVNISNSSKKQLKYWWSNAIGADHKRIIINVHPRFDYILPESSQAVKIKCLPLETGDISSIFLSCQSNNALSPAVVLSIECTVKALLIAFYYPLTSERNIRVEWNAEDYISKYDKKLGKIKLVKPKLKAEKLLHTLNLSHDTGGTKNTETDDKNSCEDEHEMSSSDVSSQSKEKENLISEKFREESWIYEGEEYYEDSDNKLLPYFDFDAHILRTHFRYQPLIVEFHVTSGIKTRKRFYLQNETPISSDFYITTKNLWKEKLEKSGEDDTNELMSGLSLVVEPCEGEIKPYEIIYFDVIASSNTWGIYTDQLIIKINLLPLHSFWIRIINDNSPISYPIYKNSTSKIPKIRFTVYKGCSSGERKLLIENTSSIPLYINWHCFIVDNDAESKPFSLVLDMLTPFMSIDEYLSMNKNLYEAVRKFFSCAFNPYKSDKNIVKTTEADKISSASSNDNSFDYVKQETDQFNFINAEVTSSVSSDQVANNKFKDTEFHLSIVPHYGTLNYDLFNIKPSELFLSPKEKKYITITVNTKSLDTSIDKIFCRACGFIRIPPIFKYKDNVYFRKDGYYLPPAEIHLECDTRKPLLFVQSSIDQRTIICHVKEFVQKMKKEIEIKKSILLKNLNEEIISAAFEIDKPFEIKRLSTQREIFCKNRGSIHPDECIKINIICKLDEDWVKRKCEDNENFSKCVSVQKRLSITFKEGFTQSVAVLIKLILPSLKVSTNYLNFGESFVGDTKLLSFTIQNLSDQPQWFEIKRNKIDRVFTLYPNKALLASRGVKNIGSEQINVYFNSKKQGNFKETVKIISEIDGLVTTCMFEGKIC